MSFYEKIIFPMKKKNNFPIGCWEFHNKIKKPNRNLNSNRIWKKIQAWDIEIWQEIFISYWKPPVWNKLLYEIFISYRKYKSRRIFFLKIPFIQGFKISCKQIFFNKNYFSSMVYYYFEGKYLPCQLRHTKN